MFWSQEATEVKESFLSSFAFSFGLLSILSSEGTGTFKKKDILKYKIILFGTHS